MSNRLRLGIVLGLLAGAAGVAYGTPPVSESEGPGMLDRHFTYRQAVTAAGTGCMAALEAERYLEAAGVGH